MFPYYSQIDCIPNLSQKWLIACITHTPSTLLYPQKGQKRREEDETKQVLVSYNNGLNESGHKETFFFWILLKIVVQPGKARYSQVQTGTDRYRQVQTGTDRYSLVQPGTARYSLVQTSIARYRE